MQASLHRLLLRRLLPATLFILLAGAGIAYWVALRSANLAYDHSLLNTALAISEQVDFYEGHPALQLTDQAQNMLLTDKYDRMYFSVANLEGMPLAGEFLPQPSAHQLAQLIQEGRVYYERKHDNRPVRIVALKTERDNMTLVVLVAETKTKRDAILRDIVLGMLVPELLLVIATLLLVGYGIHSGLAPLTGLLRQLAGRSQADLSPIAVQVPAELQPLVVEINSLLKRLEKSLVSQRHFVSDAAHQLRTPIAALQTEVEVALREAPVDQRVHLESILLAAQRLAHLVSQLLALARAEPSRSDPLPSLSLETVVHEVAEIWLPEAIKRNIDLGFDLEETPVRGNRLLLAEMLGNLIENALRHTPPGGTVTVSAGSQGTQVWLAVEDSGPGIPLGEQAKIFERFYQAAGSGSDGCGLGLAIVQAIAQQHGGKASIQPAHTLGGARFEIRLPAAPPSCA